MDAAAPVVATHSLTKRYGQVAALANCTLAVRPGEVFGLLGPNGSGKTTLLRLLMGFLRPSGGTARIAEFDCYRQSVAVHERVAYLPGDVRLFRNLTGGEVLRFFARLRKRTDSNGVTRTSPQLVSERSFAIADRLGLDTSRGVAQMSTGMRQKLALSAVLAIDAPLVILDEPTSNLDPTVRGTVLALIAEARAAGRTVIFSSHVMSEVERSCDRVAILRQGLLVHDQVMSEIRRRHRIRAKLTAAMPAVPENLRGELSVTNEGDNHVAIETPGDLAPLLGWLATLPISEAHIEPIGLQAVYELYHPAEVAA
jgi:ABC-2 type transport system ATP-binding protein